MRDLERFILLRVVDSKWMDHLDAMDQTAHWYRVESLRPKGPISRV